MSPDYEFKNIYDEYYAKILLYLKRIVGPDDAEDVTQDVFNKINTRLKGFREESKLSTWIYRIATNTAIDRFRSATYKHATKHVAIEDNADNNLQPVLEEQVSPPADQLVIQKEMNECINEYIETLPPDYKTVIVLSEMEGMTNKDISEILDISLDNVKIRLHRARTKLKALLNEACNFYYTDKNTLACDRKQVRILSKVPK